MSKYAVLLLILVLALPCGGASAGESCGECHGNAEKMREFGYPRFTVTEEEMRAQTAMPISCPLCHKGDPESGLKEEAHKGLLTLTVVDTQWNAVKRSAMAEPAGKEWRRLEPRGKNRATQFAPKREVGGELKDLPSYRTLLWHDRNPGTLAFNPVVAMQTCGVCHAAIVDGFLKSPMGGGKGAHVQSQYRAWTGVTGPQSCGLWTSPLLPPDQGSFSNSAIEVFNEHSTMPLPEKAAHNEQRKCNQCHVGCLDCHYMPGNKSGDAQHEGPHTFVKKPGSLACYGGGKSFSCHAGPLERRRGDGYLKAEFTQATPKGKEILKNARDAHEVKGIVCVDCHEPNKKSGQHADLTRNVSCAKCHQRTVAAHARGLHKKVDCASCHVALIGGYAFNFWTALEGSPLNRIQDYLVDAVSPLLVKNPRGIWIPVHVVPHTSGNVKAGEVKLSERLIFRNIPWVRIERRYFSNDAYAVTGLAKDPDGEDNDIMVWLNVDRVAHGLGKSRSCASCHASTEQKVVTGFGGGSYKDVEDGEYTLVADGEGLRVTDFSGPDGDPPAEGLEPFMDKWYLKGNFALPAIKNRKTYGILEKKYELGIFSH